MSGKTAESHRSTRLLLMLVMAFGLSACSESTSSNKRDDKPVEVRFGYFANLTHAQAVLGVSSGEFEKAIAPNRLTTKVFNAGPSLVEALFAGEIDIGYIGPGPALTAFERSKGEGIRVIAGAAANGVVIVAAPNSGINTMRDLKDKRIATPQMGNTQDISARHYILAELQSESANNVQAVPNSEQVAMMSRGQIDAAWAPEPWGARLVAEAGGKIIAEEKDLWPDKEFVLTVIVVDPKFLAAHPDIVEKILGAHVPWTARLQADAQKYVPQLHDALLELTGKSIDQKVLSSAIARVKFTNEPLAKTFDTMAQWAFDMGFAGSKQEVANLIDTTILQRVFGSSSSPAARTQPATSGPSP